MEKVREKLTVLKESVILVEALVKNRPGDRQGDSLAELTALAHTAGAVVVGRVQQKLARIHPATYIGTGKARELAEKVVLNQANAVIFDNDLTPGQIRELEEVVHCKVLDRSELILDIFATRAKTKQAKLQVELAQLEYTYPRLTRMWAHLDSVAGAGGGTAAGAVGGIGTRGTGEKQLEIDRRLVGNRITELKRELKIIDCRKLREIAGRKDFFTICIVGYTNAGKSTLMNALTDAGVYVEDKLFATLDTCTRKWRPEPGVEVLLSDTVGFVSKLPHHLVASFKATLAEAVNADLLLHIVDASNRRVFEQISSVRGTLKEIGCGQKNVLTLLNKADVVLDMQLFETLQTVHPDAIVISARTGLNIDKVAAAVAGKVKGQCVRVRVNFSPGDGKVYSFLHACGRDIQEHCDQQNMTVEITLGKGQITQLQRLGVRDIQIMD